MRQSNIREKGQGLIEKMQKNKSIPVNLEKSIRERQSKKRVSN